MTHTQELNKPNQEMISLRYFLYQAVDDQNQTIIHAIYPSLDSQRIFVLYHPSQKEKTLHLLHHLDDTITKVFGLQTVQQYVSDPSGKLRIIGYPHMISDSKSYVEILIDLTGTLPEAVSIDTTRSEANK